MEIIENLIENLNENLIEIFIKKQKTANINYFVEDFKIMVYDDISM